MDSTMAAKKRILASEVYVGNITVEASLLALAEQAKESRAQADKDREQARLDREQHREDMNAIFARMDRTEREIHMIAQAMMAMARRTDARLGALESA
jgi:phage-related minor tail protein